ncbi:MAG: Kdo hydroxylase family protein, partial [Pseudomonadota bacterium]
MNFVTPIHHLSPENFLPGAAKGNEFEQRLEQGQVLLLEPGLLQLPSENEMKFLREELAGTLTQKNISYHPHGDYLTGMKKDPVNHERTHKILREHHHVVAPFLKRLLPDYQFDSGKVNFRPLEEQGRKLSVHASNERLHVDSMASGPTYGRRILRFFTNIHPTQIRIWKTAGRFPELFREFAEAAELSHVDEDALRPWQSRRLYTRFLQWLGEHGLPQAEVVLNNPPYDRLMRRFHNFLKENDAFQADVSRVEQLEFPPFSSWIVMTDMVSHSVVSGRHALVNTFHVDLEDCQCPELAP